MKIVSIVDGIVPISSDIRNAYVDFSHMTASIVAVVTDVVRNGRPIVGYGFSSNGRYAVSGILRDRIFPRLLAADPTHLADPDRDNLSPHRAWDVMMQNEKPGGHGERSTAIGTVDMALWDAVAKIEDARLCDVIAQRFGNGTAQDSVFVYAAGGYYQPAKGIKRLREEMRSYLDRGYTMVKMKIGGAPLSEDIARIEAVLDVVGGDGQDVAVDANGRLDLSTALKYAQALEPYGLRWLEEFGDPLDYALQAALADASPGPFATGENLFSLPDVRNLIRYAGLRPNLDTLQMDCTLSYGFVEYLRILDMLSKHGWSARQCIPHGGHAMSLAIAAGLGLGGNESYPDVFAPFGSFGDDLAVTDGRIQVPDRPGIGLEGNSRLYSLLRQLHRE